MDVFRINISTSISLLYVPDYSNRLCLYRQE